MEGEKKGFKESKATALTQEIGQRGLGGLQWTAEKHRGTLKDETSDCA